MDMEMLQTKLLIAYYGILSYKDKAWKSVSSSLSNELLSQFWQLIKSKYLIFCSQISMLEASKANENRGPVDERLIRSQDLLHKMEYNREAAAHRMKYGSAINQENQQEPGSVSICVSVLPFFAFIEHTVKLKL